MNLYFEQRNAAARGTDSLAADIARHMHSRQQLGTVVIICAQPMPMLSAIRKQWMRLTRSVQRQRASTLNADKIMKYTRTITQMQYMHFTTKPPGANPHATIYCLTPSDISSIPKHCYSVYTLLPLGVHIGQIITRNLPEEALIVDYDHGTSWKTYGLQPKYALEERVIQTWDKLRRYIQLYHVDPHALHNGSTPNMLAMDTALDTLLDVGSVFLQSANEFQHALVMARPLRLAKSVRLEYDAVILLAHRVQALSPGDFSHRFLDAYNEDDSFFLYDSGSFHNGESVRERFERYQQQGHHRLAQAFLHTFGMQ